MFPLGAVIRSYGISFYFYADDTQLHIPVELEDPDHIQKVESCLTAVKSCMSQNILQLFTEKTEQVIIVRKQDQRKFVVVCNLGVLFDPLLCFDQHVRS